MQKTKITVETTVNAPVDKVWRFWTDPKEIIHWSFATTEWHTPYAENDVRTGGKFFSRMEAWDGSAGFDFGGQYTKVEPLRNIEYTLGDGRKVSISFEPKADKTIVKETFEAEHENSPELQQAGWQAILDNFKKHVEKSDRFEKLHYEILINAPAKKVYEILTGKKTWPEWTAAFDPSSRYEGSWSKGSRLLFLGSDQDGDEGGMISMVNENIPNRFISVEHVGVINKGKEYTTGHQAETWSGAWENYSLTEENGKTKLSVDNDVARDYVSYFNTTWPKALKMLQDLCEQGTTNK